MSVQVPQNTPAPEIQSQPPVSRPYVKEDLDHLRHDQLHALVKKQAALWPYKIGPLSATGRKAPKKSVLIDGLLDPANGFTTTAPSNVVSNATGPIHCVQGPAPKFAPTLSKSKTDAARTTSYQKEEAVKLAQVNGTVKPSPLATLLGQINAKPALPPVNNPAGAIEIEKTEISDSQTLSGTNAGPDADVNADVKMDTPLELEVPVDRSSSNDTIDENNPSFPGPVAPPQELDATNAALEPENGGTPRRGGDHFEIGLHCVGPVESLETAHLGLGELNQQWSADEALAHNIGGPLVPFFTVPIEPGDANYIASHNIENWQEVTVYITDHRATGEPSKEMVSAMVNREPDSICVDGTWWASAQTIMAYIQISAAEIHGIAKVSVEGSRPGFKVPFVILRPNKDPHYTENRVLVSAQNEVDFDVNAPIEHPPSLLGSTPVALVKSEYRDARLTSKRSASPSDPIDVDANDDSDSPSTSTKRVKLSKHSTAWPQPSEKKAQREDTVAYLKGKLSLVSGYSDFVDSKGKVWYPNELLVFYKFAYDFIEKYDNTWTSILKNESNPHPTAKTNRVHKNQMLEALKRDTSWEADMRLTLRLVALMGPGKPNEDTRVIKMLAQSERKKIGSVAFLRELKERAVDHNII